MSIGVQSYPELYTMLLGWNLYDKLWDLLTKTGIAYLPFIGMILKNVSQSYLKIHDGGPIALRNMELNLITTTLLILFGVAPAIPIHPNAIVYSPICQIETKSFLHPNNTGTTYDKAFTLPTNEVRVPIWWYLVIAVSEGLTSASNTSVGCASNLRTMVTTVAMTKISDPELKQQLQDFAEMCFIPAREKFFHETELNKKSDLKNFYLDDTDWFGSKLLNQKYYSDLFAKRPVSGFIYNASEDINADIHQAHPPKYGMPSCYAWWNDEENGLKNRLYQTLPSDFFNLNKLFLTNESAREQILKKLLINVNGYQNANSMTGDYGYSHLVSAVGTWYQELVQYPKLYAAEQAAPIIRALILFLIYTFLPFALVFSSYRGSSFIAGSIMIFSVIYWQFIFQLVQWLDSSLMQALYSNWFVRQGAGATLADMIIGALIILAPLFWFIFMGSMGIAVGNVVSSISFGANKLGQDAAGSVGNKVGSLAMTATKAAVE